MYTYKKIAELTNNKPENIRCLVTKLNLPRKLIKGLVHLSEDSYQTILIHLAPRTSRTENGRHKIRVIERFIIDQNYRPVARVCGINKQTVKKIVDEWEETGCIVVDSSMNFPPKTTDKNIFKKNSNWGYSFMHKGVRYYKSGFVCEHSAIEAFYRKKEEVKNKL